MSKDFAQIRALVAKESGSLSDESCVRVYIGSSSGNPSGQRLFHHIQSEIESRGLPVRVIKTGSFGCCDLEPIAIVDAPGRFVHLCFNAGLEIAADIEALAGRADSAHCSGDWYLVGGADKGHVPLLSGLPMFNLQNRIVLRNCGWVDPRDLRHYILSANGFAGLSRALTEGRHESFGALLSLFPEGYVQNGCATRDQWKECLESKSSHKHLVCDAVTADPVGQRTSLLLESDPHSVLEGMLIGAYMIGASRCILYVRAGSGIAGNLRSLLDAMLSYNLAGPGILGSDFDAQIEIREVDEHLGAGNKFESIRCIGQNLPAPHILPAYPAIEELTANPGILATPELMSFLPAVFFTDRELEKGFGANRNRACVIVALSGSVVHAMTAEIPCGVSISSLIEGIGGGVTGNKALKAIQVGVPAGVLLGPGELDGCMHCRTAGETGMVTIDVIDSEADIVAMAGERMREAIVQSCGKCLFCSEGSRQMLYALERIAAGNGKSQDPDLLMEIGKTMKTACLCAFGLAAPDFVLSSMELYRDEYGRRTGASSRDAQTV